MRKKLHFLAAGGSTIPTLPPPPLADASAKNAIFFDVLPYCLVAKYYKFKGILKIYNLLMLPLLPLPPPWFMTLFGTENTFSISCCRITEEVISDK